MSVLGLTFLGHQGWAIHSPSTFVLLDPILRESFGHSPQIQFEIFPPRRIDVSSMPPPTAFILSHEHLDHFHIPSLASLPKTCGCHISTLMPSCVEDALCELGFLVTRHVPQQGFFVGDLEFTFFSPGAATVFWEKRVHQVLVQLERNPQSSAFIAVDALVSDEFKEAIHAKRLSIPHVIICSNNSQIVPSGAHGAYSNLLPLPDELSDRFCGIRLLNELLIRYLEGLPPIETVILCGNGFVSSKSPFGPFPFSRQDLLAQSAQALSRNTRVLGPLPGDDILFHRTGMKVQRADWITLDDDRLSELERKLQRWETEPRPVPMESLTTPLLSPIERASAVERVRQELDRMVPSIMLSPAGILSLELSEYVEGSLGPLRLLFRFLDGPDCVAAQFALDFCRAKFVEDRTDTADLLSTFPLGIEMHLSDFLAVLDGDLQIWDVAGSAMRSWYIGGRYNNVVAFLYAYYGEQVRPDLASKVYRRALHSLLH